MKSDYKVSRRHLLSSCIKVEEKRINRHTSIPSQVYFELNLDIVNRIEEIKAEYGSLYLKPEQLTNLRYYSLINFQIKRDRSSLIFSSNYLSTNSDVQTTVVRSTINLTGQIFQEVQRDLWQDKTLSSQVIQAHHWLTTEILRQLPLKSNNHTSLIFWVLWVISAIVFTSVIWYFVSLPFLFNLTANIALLLSLKILIKHIIYHRLKQWIIQQLTCGWLSNTTHQRQLGFKLLSFL